MLGSDRERRILQEHGDECWVKDNDGATDAMMQDLANLMDCIPASKENGEKNASGIFLPASS